MNMTIDTGTTDPVSQKPYPTAMKHYQWVKEEIEKLLAAKVILPQLLQLVSTYYSCTKRQWRKMFGNRLQSSQQINKEIHMAHDKGRRYLF